MPESKFGIEHLLGNTNVPRYTNPSIRGSVRRNDPDVTYSYPYVVGLTGGMELHLDVDGTLVDVTFSSNSFQGVIDSINLVNPSVVLASDDNGYLRLTSMIIGGTGYLKILASTSAQVLGLEVDPVPGSISYAGDIRTSPAGRAQVNPQGTSFISQDEELSSGSVNRALASVLDIALRTSRNLLREVPVMQLVPVTAALNTASSKIVLRVTDPTIRVNIRNSLITPIANPQAESLDRFFKILDGNFQNIYITDDGINPVIGHAGDRIKINAVHYTSSLTQALSTSGSFAAFGTPDGLSIFGDDSHIQKPKHASVGITKIKGNVLQCDGALFVSAKVQAGDALVISGSTANQPFNHNGEFVIDEVFDETHLSVRAKSVEEDLVFSSLNRPTGLNSTATAGLGSASVPIGYYLPATALSFVVDNNQYGTIVAGTSYVLLVTVARKLKSLSSLTNANYGVMDLAGWLALPDKTSKQLWDHINDPVDSHDASAISTTGTPSWVRGDTPENPDADVQTQINKLITDLSTTTVNKGGARLLGIEVLPTYLDGTTHLNSVQEVLDTLFTKLKDQTVNCGATNIGLVASSNVWADATTDGLTIGNVRTRAEGIVSAIASKAASDGASKVGIAIPSAAWADSTTLGSSGTVRGRLEKIVTDLSAAVDINNSGSRRVGSGVISVTTSTPMGSLPATIPAGTIWNQLRLLGEWIADIASAAGGTTGSNLGVGSQVFESKVGSVLRFRTLKSDAPMLTVVEGLSTIDFDINANDLNSSGTVIGIRGRPVHSAVASPSVGNILKWDGTYWNLAADEVSGGGGGVAQVAAGTGILVTNPTGPTATVAVDVTQALSWGNTQTYSGNPGLLTGGSVINPFLKGTTVISRQLVWESNNSIGAKARMYASYKGMEWTYNARWDGSIWNRDVATWASIFKMETYAAELIARTMYAFKNADVVVTWTDSQWLKSIINQAPYFENSNPVVGAHTLVRAYGVINGAPVEPGAPSLVSGYGLGTIANSGADSILVGLSPVLTITDYTVIAMQRSNSSGAGATGFLASRSHTFSDFILECIPSSIVGQYNSGTTRQDITFLDNLVQLIVFGGPG